jgi:hypothetical protein
MAIGKIVWRSSLQRAQVVQLIVVRSVEIVVVDVVVIVRSKRAPGDPAGAVIKANKAGRPEVKAKRRTRYPAPSEGHAVMPSAIVVRQPTPRFIGYPSPSPKRAIAPPPYPVWGPEWIHIVRYPRGTICIHRYPSAIRIKFGNSHVDVVGQILATFISQHVCVPAVVPIIPIIPPVIAGEGICALFAGSHMNEFAGFHTPRELVIGCFELSLPHNRVGVAILDHVEPVDSFAQSIEGRRGRVHFETNPAPDSEGREAKQHPDLDEVFLERKDFHVSLLGEAIDRAIVEFNLRPCVISRIDPISGLQRRVNAGGSPVHLAGVLKANMTIQV